jgi:hypothetical protein
MSTANCAVAAFTGFDSSCGGTQELASSNSTCPLQDSSDLSLRLLSRPVCLPTRPYSPSLLRCYPYFRPVPYSPPPQDLASRPSAFRSVPFSPPSVLSLCLPSRPVPMVGPCYPGFRPFDLSPTGCPYLRTGAPCSDLSPILRRSNSTCPLCPRSSISNFSQCINASSPVGAVRSVDDLG